MKSRSTASSKIKTIAQIGLVSKAIVYTLLGTLAFMAAFNIAGQSTNNTDKEGVFNIIYEQTGGKIMLGIIALGLFCYSIWRGIQTFADTEKKESKLKGLVARTRYFISGLIYASLAAFALKIVFNEKQGSGNKKQGLIEDTLNQPNGEWLLAIPAIVIICVGLYQGYYGLSEKYKKHVDKADSNDNKKLIITAGKVGYVARCVVWLLIGWLFIKAAFHKNSSEAGDTSKAFKFLEEASYGTYLLAIVAVGLICYGVFNFIRARYETFN
jgi:uncharacterized membrane protein YiaA